MPRPATSHAIRQAALLRDRGLCCNCSQPADHTHHIVPLICGGQDVLSNVVAICSTCHGKVHNRSFGLDHRAATKAGLAVAKAKGVRLGGIRPGQAKAHAIRAQKATEGSERLRGLLAPMVQAGQSLRAMAAALEAAAVPTAAGAATWSPMQVSRALKRLELHHQEVAK